MSEPHGADPGWYPDPPQGRQRYWDGTQCCHFLNLQARRLISGSD